MLPREQPDRIHITFDDQRMVSNTGLIPQVTLAHHMGLGEVNRVRYGGEREQRTLQMGS